MGSGTGAGSGAGSGLRAGTGSSAGAGTGPGNCTGAGSGASSCTGSLSGAEILSFFGNILHWKSWTFPLVARNIPSLFIKDLFSDPPSLPILVCISRSPG